MSSRTLWQQLVVSPPVVTDSSRWYAIHTRARHEKMVTTRLQEQGITTFLPTTTEVRRWSDRRKLVEFPLFSCYAFVNVPWLSEVREKVERTNGVLGFVGVGGSANPIPDVEIENIRTLLRTLLPYTAYPFLKIGQRVRVRGGPLDGVEGILVARNKSNTLVISVEPIQRSLAIQIDDYSVEPV